MIPIGFYGDAAQLLTKVKTEKLLCFWMNIVIFRPRSIRYSRFLLWSCDTSLLYKNRTTNTILRWLVWSFNALNEGKHPLHRPGNKPLESQSERDRAGTWITHQQHQFQLVECRGDWEFHKLLWQFKCSWKGGVNVGICFRCPSMLRCADPSLLYWNMDDEASSWAQQEFDTVDFICQRLPPQNIWRLVGDKRNNMFLQHVVLGQHCCFVCCSSYHSAQGPNVKLTIVDHMFWGIGLMQIHSKPWYQVLWYRFGTSTLQWSSGVRCMSSTLACLWVSTVEHWTFPEVLFRSEVGIGICQVTFAIQELNSAVRTSSNW